MKIACLLPLPLLLVPFTQAADYLVRFKEGPPPVTAAATADKPLHGISRIESLYGKKGLQPPTFDYTSTELSLTVLSLSRAKALAHKSQKEQQKHRLHHPNVHSKARVEAMNTFDEEVDENDDHDDHDKKTTTSSSSGDDSGSVKIKSKGRWFTFDDSDFHVWHGDFSEEEAKLLAGDAGVDLVEKDIVIRFPELEKYADHAAMAGRVKRLEDALDEVDEQMRMMTPMDKRDSRESKAEEEEKEEEKKKKKSSHSEEGHNDDEVRIPNLKKEANPNNRHREGEQQPNNGRKGKGAMKKPRPSTGKVWPIDAKDTAGPNNAYMIQQRAPSWGLPRVSQRNLPLKSDYNYPTSAGEGIDVYVIDTGINIHHIDFEGRARWGITTVPGAPNTDDNGHGTFVAGVIGSRTFGVAKKVRLIAVKGLNKEGTSTLSQILAALDWTIKQGRQSPNQKNVVNLSLGAGYSKVLNSAVDALVQSGMFIVAAAGNGDERNVGQNACRYSPASTPTAFTVGSTNINDQLSSFSNYGQCVNMYAPGERVRSTWIGPTNREINTDSGTSFSAPNVAGIAALIMGAERGDRSDGSWSPKNIGNRILQLGTRNVVRNFKGPANTNILAFNGAGVLGVNNGNNGGNNGGDNGGNNGGDGGDNGGGGGGGGGDGGDGGDDGGSIIPPFSGDSSSNPRYVNGAGSKANLGPTLNAIQAMTTLSTAMATIVLAVVFW
ncbi:serine protease [Mortierella alpina]|nr:serine protease [Mortierella alpina]